MKATEQYFHVVLFIMLHTFKSVNETLVCDLSKRKLLFRVVLFIKLYRLVLSVNSVNQTLVCDHIKMEAIFRITFTYSSTVFKSIIKAFIF